MNFKKLFNILSKLCLVLFYLILVLGTFSLMTHLFYIWKPESSFTKSLGSFEPILTHLNITFYEQPPLFKDTSFIFISFLSEGTTLLLVTLFLWFMFKLLKNISIDSLFMYENASILLRLGIIIIIVGSVSEYTSGIVQSKTLSVLQVTNAEVGFANIFYIDTLVGGIVLIIIALALKKAVHAVEENKQTI